MVLKLPWREAGPPNHHDAKVDSDTGESGQVWSASRMLGELLAANNVPLQGKRVLEVYLTECIY